jgi:hypothetical protein
MVFPVSNVLFVTGHSLHTFLSQVASKKVAQSQKIVYKRCGSLSKPILVAARSEDKKDHDDNDT